MSLQYKYFNLWRDIIARRKWNDIWDEERAEIEYAEQNGMGPIYWCMNCRYGVCEEH